MRLHVIFDPDDILTSPGVSGDHYPPNLKAAVLSLAADPSEVDIYEVARKLAELLLEQISRDG
jgi:hypothetical protein